MKVRDFKQAMLDYLDNDLSKMDEEKRNAPYVASCQGTFSLQDIRNEVEAETEYGLHWIEMMQDLAMDLFLRSGLEWMSPDKVKLARRFFNVADGVLKEEYSFSDLYETIASLGEELKTLEKEEND